MRTYIPPVPSLVFLVSLLCLGTFAADHAKPAGYVGSETCKSCHDEAYTSLSESAHKKLFTESKPEKQGCEACHGPGQAHVDGNGDASKIFRFTDARAPQVRARCGACHESLSVDSHTNSSASCLSCHSPHHYQQKKFLLLKTR